jgi:hypothetical protein
MKLDKDKMYIKIIELNEIYKFIADNFLYIVIDTHFKFSYFEIKIFK